MLNPRPNEDLELRLAIVHMAFALERAGAIQSFLSLHLTVQITRSCGEPNSGEYSIFAGNCVNALAHEPEPGFYTP